MNIKKLILNGEGQSLDFKKTITSFEKIAKTMVAFANNKGGRLLIGVLDDGSIKGVKSEDEEHYMIIRSAHFFCRPQLEPTFTDLVIDNKVIVVVDIAESDTKPHYALGEDNHWWVYIRIKDKSVLASSIVVDVLKKEQLGDNLLLSYTQNEKVLFSYLQQHEKITLPEFCKLIHTTRKIASRILVNLILMGMLKVHTTEKIEYYLPSKSLTSL